MGKLKNIEELEKLLKDGLDGMEVPAPTEVWTAVSGASAGQASTVLSKLGSYFSSITNVVKVALFVGGISTAAIMLYKDNVTKVQSDETNTSSKAAQENTGIKAENPNQEQLEDFSNAGNQNTDNQEVGVNDRADSESDAAEITTDNEPNELEQPGTGLEQPSAEEPNPRSAVSIQSISKECCKGETRTFNSGTTAGDWFVNGQKVKSNSVVMSHRFTQGGKNVVQFRSALGLSEFPVQVQEVDLNIVVKNLHNGQYLLSLAQDIQVVRWLIDGVELSSAQSIQPILKVGKVHVAVEARSGECTFLSEQVLDIKPLGNFSSPDIFTPNNDNDNETYFVDIDNYESFVLQVFDPVNNQRVFTTQDPKVGWNGRIDNTGKECPSGVYAVKVTYKLIGEPISNKNIKLTLKRD